MTPPHRLLLTAFVAAAVLTPGAALAHELFDHAPPSLTPQPAPTTAGANMGPETAQWEFVESIATGNPHSDLDFFRSDGDIYASAGTLGVAPNGGGQTIVRLTDGDEVVAEHLVAGDGDLAELVRLRTDRPVTTVSVVAGPAGALVGDLVLAARLLMATVDGSVAVPSPRLAPE